MIDFIFLKNFSVLTFINVGKSSQKITSMKIKDFFYSNSFDILEKIIKLVHELQKLKKIDLFARRFKLDSVQMIKVIFNFYSVLAAIVSLIVISSMSKEKN